MRAWFAPSSRARVECFFCTSRCLLVPPAPSRGALAKGKHRALDENDGPVAVGSRDDFWCGQCGQINRRDQNGDILSDDAAHWDPALNRDSFDKRASTSRHRLPPSFPSPSTTPFCRQCLANQSLQLHLLASYPSSSDDEADESYPPLETYRQSLDQRYPLVCATCAPAVEGTIRERDYRVKAQALGWRLRETQRRREREERRGEEARRRDGVKWLVEGLVWRARGAAWLVTGGGTATACLVGLLDPSDLHGYAADSSSNILRHGLIPLTVLSLFWSFWDPTWARLRAERARGRNYTVSHRPTYLVFQMLAYCARLITLVLLRSGVVASSATSRWLLGLTFVISCISLLSALFLPRLKPPSPIRLSSRPSSTSLSATSASASHPYSSLAHPALDPLEPLAHLSLSRPGSFLACTPPDTPTSAGGGGGGGGTPQRSETPGSWGRGSARNATPSGGAEARVPSFGLAGWRNRETTPSGHEAGPRDGRGLQEEESVDAGDNSMDWTPIPPASTSTPSGSPFPPAPFASASAATNHITFARQRLIPPDLRQPTGLEGMFAKVVALRGGGGGGAEGDEPGEGMDGVEMSGKAVVEGEGVTGRERGTRWWTAWW